MVLSATHAASARAKLNAATSSYDVRNYGAKGDAKKVTDGAQTNGSATVTSATANFTQADVGKTIWGTLSAGNLVMSARTITAVNSSTSITVSSSNSATWSNVILVWGTNDTAAIQAACTAARAARPLGLVTVPPGGYIYDQCLFDYGNPVGGGPNIGTMGFVGAGPASTIFYQSPSFSFATTAANQGMFCKNTTGGDVYGMRMGGFTVDGCFLNVAQTSYYVLTLSCSNSRFSDIHVKNFQNIAGGIRVNGGEALFERIRVEQIAGNGYGIVVVTPAQFIECYSGNSAGAFAVVNLDNSNNTVPGVTWQGGVLDECGTNVSVSLQNAKDVVFIGATMYGGDGASAALTVDGTSVAKVFGCRITGYSTSGNRSGANISSGGKLYASGSVFAKTGTGVSLTNAGTVYDLGGNTFGTVTNTGTLGVATVTYSASMTPDASLAPVQTITATNSTAFTINAPTNPTIGQRLTITIRNTSGGALGTATWNAVFKMASWTQPGDTNSRSITFCYNGTNWIEQTRTASDIPN